MNKANIALSFGAVLAITGGLMAKFAIYYWLGAAGYLLLVVGVLIIMALKDL